MLVLLLLLLLALPVAPIPNPSKRDILSILGPATDTSSTPRSTHPLTPTLKLSSATPSGKPSLSTSRSSLDRWTPAPTTDSAQQTPARTTLASTPPSLQVAAADHSSKTWQIIGIVIIAVLFVATSITCTMFFDRLWRFFKNVVCCTSRPLVSDEFVSDCEKQIWDTRTTSPSPSLHHHNESLHREQSVYAARTRELPWNTHSQDWNTLYR